MKAGDKVKLVRSGYSSNNSRLGDGNVYIVKEEVNGKYKISDGSNNSLGFVYLHEMILVESSIDDLEGDLEDAINKVEDIKLKIAWLEETGNKVFNEDEFKVYKTLKLLENSELSIIEKSKLISKLIK